MPYTLLRSNNKGENIMAENYSLNSGFGFNITNKNLSTAKKGVAQQSENIKETVGNLFDSMTSYVAKYEDVFNGDVTKEINMYSRQSMIVGMNLKASDKNIHKFDMNI